MINLSLENDKVKELLSILSAGSDLDVACHASGLSVNTVLSWLERGKHEEARVEVTNTKMKKTEEVYYNFWCSVRKGRALAIVKAQETIIRAFHDDWKAAAWYLEKELPNKYGKNGIQESITKLDDKLKELGDGRN